MFWVILWMIGLVEFGRVIYVTLASLSLNELPRSALRTRWGQLYKPIFGGVISTFCFGLTAVSIDTNSSLSLIAALFGAPILFISYWAIRCASISIGAYTPYELEEQFDLFISYRRTLHAERVRRIVEILISKGVRVWLDDYAMFAINIQREADINESIRTGITNSKHALIFRSKDYNKSKWCRYEREVLKSCFSSSPTNILSHPQPKTDESEHAEVELILKELRTSASSGEKPRIDDNFVAESNFFRDERAGYQFDARDGLIISQGGYFFLGDQYKGPTLTLQRGPYRLNLDIILGPSATYPGNLNSSWRQGDRYAIMHRAFDDLFMGAPYLNADEKTLWHAGHHFARSYEKMRGVAIRGSHIFVLGKDYHYAVTYWDGRGWVRRYSIVAIDPVTWVRLEIAIAFKFFGPFLRFCAHTYQMDALVQSFRPVSVD